MRRIGVWCALCVAVLLAGCGSAKDVAGSYSIAIVTSSSAKPNPFAGSFQFFRDGQRITRELSANGTHSVNFEADQLVFVRVHGNSPDTIYSLSITRNGEIEFASPAVPADQPLIYHAPR